MVWDCNWGNLAAVGDFFSGWCNAGWIPIPSRAWDWEFRDCSQKFRSPYGMTLYLAAGKVCCSDQESLVVVGAFFSAGVMLAGFRFRDCSQKFRSPYGMTLYLAVGKVSCSN